MKKSLRALVLMILSVMAFAFPRTLMAQSWTGRWIWQSVDGPSDTWMCFRKTFSLDSAPATATAFIAVDSKYWLWVNDSLVVFEGGLKRGPNPNDSYYDEVELARYLTAGANTIALLVDYWGVEGFSHKSSGKGGLVFQMDAGGTRVQSDAAWRIKKHPAFEICGTQPNGRISERSVRFNGQKDIPDWNKKAYNDAAWEGAVEKGVPPCTPWNNLVKRPIPQWKSQDNCRYVNIAQLGLPKAGPVNVTARTPYNAQVHPRITLRSATPGLVVSMNSSTNAEPNLIAEYVTRGDGSDETFEMPCWINGDGILYKIPSGVTLQDIGYRETSYDAETAGSFTCDKAFYGDLWTKAMRTLRVCMRDNYYDCPDRERAQWWGDAVVEIGETFYALDRRSDLLSKKAILELVNWQRADKALFSPIPTGIANSEMPVQMLASIGWEGFWNYYRYSGDAGILMDAYPHIKDYLSLCTLDADGLLVHRGSGEFGSWTDWGANIDTRVLENCWYYLALKSASAMAQLAGQTADTAIYSVRMRSIETNFDRVLWNATLQAYRSPGQTFSPDDRANAMAVIAELAAPSRLPGIIKVLSGTMNASPWMEKWVEEALFKMGKDSAALERMSARYESMMAGSGSTLWEFWETTGTLNHAWAGGPLTLLSRYVAGVAPDSPGFGRYHVLPQLGALKAVSAKIPSPKGDIAVDISTASDRVALTLSSPEGTTALVGIPRNGKIIDSILVNSHCVWRMGAFVSGTAGITDAGSDGLYVYFAADPGALAFTAYGHLNYTLDTVSLDNFSFEAPLISGFQMSPTDPAWTYTGQSGIEHNGSAFGAADAPDGLQAALIQGLGSISQQVSFEDGYYRVIFQAAKRSYGGIQTVKVLFDSVEAGSFDIKKTDFLEFQTTPILVLNGAHQLDFRGVSAGDNTAFIDAVRLEKMTYLQKESPVAPETGISLDASPNPFNPSVKIQAGGCESGAELRIFNVNGKLAADLTGALNANPHGVGMHDVVWNAAGHGSGMYLVVLKNGKVELKRKVFLIR